MWLSDGDEYFCRLDGADISVTVDLNVNDGRWEDDLSEDTNSSTVACLKIGASELAHHQGEIAEIMAYGRLLSADEIAEIEEYAASMYGITLA